MHGKRCRCGSYTVLCHAGTRSHLFRRHFVATGVPCGVFNNMGFCTHGRIGSLLTCLGAVSGKRSSLTIQHVVGVPGHKVNTTSVGGITLCTRRRRVDFCSTLYITRRMPKLNGTTTGVQPFILFVRSVGTGTGLLSITSLLRRIVRAANCIERLRTRKASRTRTEVRGVSRLVDGTISCTRKRRTPALGNFLRGITLITSVSDFSRGDSCIMLVALRDTGKLRFPGICLTKLRSKLFPDCVSVADSGSRTRVRRRQHLTCIKVAHTGGGLAVASTHIHVIQKRARCKGMSHFIERVPARLLSKGVCRPGAGRRPVRRSAFRGTHGTFQAIPDCNKDKCKGRIKRKCKSAFHSSGTAGPMCAGIRGRHSFNSTNKTLSCRIKSHIHRVGFNSKRIVTVISKNESCRIAMSFSGIKAGGVFTDFTGLGGV